MPDDPSPDSGYTADDLGVDKLTKMQVSPQLVMVDRLHYQRPRIEAKVQALMDVPDHVASHSVLIGMRKSGAMLCPEGQHHVEAALRLGLPTINANVFASDGWKCEAAVYGKYHAWRSRQAFDDGLADD